ncbi:hypothetical protein EDB84DRAFT_1548901 [Lactarius hengduanensis]|nr:hypothetical protein EDB84DRAFT_1548901 [Lactarius hengduanensis]
MPTHSTLPAARKYKKVRRYDALVLAWLVAFAPMHDFSPAMPEMPSVGSCEMMVQEVHRHEMEGKRLDSCSTRLNMVPGRMSWYLCPMTSTLLFCSAGSRESLSKATTPSHLENATIVIAAHIVGLHGSEWPQRGRYPLRRRRRGARGRGLRRCAELALVRSALRRSPCCRHHQGGAWQGGG